MRRRYGTAQRPPESLEVNLDEIAACKAHALTVTQAIRAKKVNMIVTGMAVVVELEVMVLNVLQVVAHFCFPGANLS